MFSDSVMKVKKSYLNPRLYNYSSVQLVYFLQLKSKNTYKNFESSSQKVTMS